MPWPSPPSGSSASNPAVVVGNVASGAADTGNPVKVGGRFNATTPTLADGSRGDLQLDPRGALEVALKAFNSGSAIQAVTSIDAIGVGGSNPGVSVFAKNGAYNGATYDSLRTPNIFKTAVATAAGNTAIWTPSSGKKFRLMGYVIYLTADAKLNAAADLEITFQDNTTAIGIGFSSYVPAALTPGDVTLASGVVQLGNGYLAVAANDVLNVNLSAALTGGEVRVSAWGTEE